MKAVQLPSYADTVVIGGGTAGAAATRLLAERGDQSVLLLEAGPDYGPYSQGRWPSELLDGRIVAETHDWSYMSAASNGRAGHTLERARVIGGCSSHNGCIALWGSRFDYDGWAAAGNYGWSTEEVLPYFRRASGRLKVREFSADEVTPFHRACLEAMVGSGLPATEDLNDMDANVAAAISPVNIREGVRWNASFAYLDPVRDSRHLTVVGDAMVDKINLEGPRVVSVDAVIGGERMTVGAGRVVLCGGAYGSPAVLMRSGVGAAGDLARLGIETVVDLPGVGKNLNDHPAFGLNYRSTRLFNSLMDEFIAEGRTVFAEQSLAKARSAGMRGGIRPSHCSNRIYRTRGVGALAVQDSGGAHGAKVPGSSDAEQCRFPQRSDNRHRLFHRFRGLGHWGNDGRDRVGEGYWRGKGHWRS